MNCKSKYDMKKVLTIAAASLMMASCGLYNKYERPDDVNTAGHVRDLTSDTDTLAVAPQDTASFGNLPWRSVFTDPQLQQLIEQGLAKNANLQNAALTVQMYETMLKAALEAAGKTVTKSSIGIRKPFDTEFVEHGVPRGILIKTELPGMVKVD